MQSSARTVHMGQCAGLMMMSIEDSISQCPFLQMTYTAENPHADGSAAPGARPRYRPPRHRNLHAPHTRQLDGGKTDVLSSANGPCTAALQQRCHRTSASARSPSWPPTPGPRLQRAATIWPERTQLSVLRESVCRRVPVASPAAG
jgi:hypothetical protein